MAEKNKPTITNEFDNAFEEDMQTSVENEDRADKVVEPQPPTEDTAKEELPEKDMTTEELPKETTATGEKVDYEQMYKSYKGIFDAKLKEYQDRENLLKAEIERLKGKSISPEQSEKSPESEKFAKPDESGRNVEEAEAEYNKVIASFKEDYPEIADPVISILQHETNKITSAIDKKLSQYMSAISAIMSPIVEHLIEIQREKHFSAIRAAHSDFDSLRDSKAVLKWIESQPAYLKEPLMEVYNSGTAEDVISLLDTYKKSSGYKREGIPLAESPSAIAKPTSINSERAIAAEAVPRRGLVIPKGGMDNKSIGFDDAFEEALKYS